jgi:hypothetical protein
MVSQLCLLSRVSKHGTHCADCFLMPKISCRSFEMPRCLLFQLSRAPSIDDLPIRDHGFFHVILHGSYFRGTWAWLIKNRRVTTLKLVKPIFDSHHRRRRVTVHSIQALFDFAARFPFQKQESNHQPILLFFHFSKICRHTRFHMLSKQNYESNSAEILTVAVYENLSCDTGIIGR